MKALLTLSTIILTSIATAGSATVLDAMGDRDFADNVAPGGVANFEGANAGDPTGFNEFRGSDFGSSFATFSFSHSFAPLTGATSASLTLGIYDHDSTTSSQPGLSIMFDGVAQDVSMWAGISATPAYNYIRAMSVDLALLADGNLDVVISSLGVPGQNGNGLGIDFSELSAEIGAVPVPASGLLILGALGGIAAIKRKRSKA